MSGNDFKRLILTGTESLLITVLFLVLSNVALDPLSRNSPFPWIWFAPVLIALRYGLFFSQLSIALLVFAWLYQNPEQLALSEFQLFVLGGFLMTVACAGFHNSWIKKVTSSESISEYLQKKIQTISNSYKIVTLSYKRLEHDFIAKPVTIRSSLDALRKISTENTHPQAYVLNRFLNILANQCSLEKAGIFPVRNKRILPEPLCTVGEIKLPDKEEYIIEECLDQEKMTYVSAQEILLGHFSNYLVAAPFIDQNNVIYALLLIEEMPFLSLNTENLGVINLLLQYYLEGGIVSNAAPIMNTWKDCPPDFANELARLMAMQKKIGQDSALQIFILAENVHREDFLFRLKQEVRGLDSYWETDQNNTKCLMVLMPLTNRYALEGYNQRMRKILLDEFRLDFNENAIRIRSCQLSSFNNPLQLIEDLLKQ